MWLLVNDPEVPDVIQKKARAFGLTKGEFPETGGWPHELYVREGRRMISAYVMTQHNCLSKVVAEDSVGMASYNMDSHNCQRVVIDGKVRNEGDVQVGCPRPYPVSYRSIVPKESECTNLFVPVCLSSTHISYGSIRMEPVFMILGQSAGTAAAMAIDDKISVQKVEYTRLREKLLADKQTLEYKGPLPTQKGAGIDPKTIPGIVIDNTQAKVTGEWSRSAAIGPFVGEDYLHDGAAGQGTKSAEFTAKLPASGEYDIFLIWSANPNRASNVVVEIHSPEGVVKKSVNQKAGSGWNKIATVRVKANEESRVVVRNSGANGHVIADAVRWQIVDPKK